MLVFLIYTNPLKIKKKDKIFNKKIINENLCFSDFNSLWSLDASVLHYQNRPIDAKRACGGRVKGEMTVNWRKR